MSGDFRKVVRGLIIGLPLSIFPAYGAIQSQAPELLPQEPTVIEVPYLFTPIPVERETITVIPQRYDGTKPDSVAVTIDTKEQILEEILMGGLEEVAQCVYAEAGNQSYWGKRYVAAVIFNRVDSPIFPNTIHGVIFQKGQFSTVENGAFYRAGWTVTEDDFKAVYDEWNERSNREILYFTAHHYGKYGTPAFQYEDHYFCK